MLRLFNGSKLFSQQIVIFSQYQLSFKNLLTLRLIGELRACTCIFSRRKDYNEARCPRYTDTINLLKIEFLVQKSYFPFFLNVI